MTEPILLFLHGVKAEDGEKSWQKGLALGLQAAGYPNSSESQTKTPFYRDLLTTKHYPKVDAPLRTPVDLVYAHQRRGSYDVAQASLRRLLALGEADIHHDRRDPGVFAKAPQHLPGLNEAHRYITTPELRANVWHRVIETLPPNDDCDVVVIAHSLGSLVAINLLGHLPRNVHIRRLITIGSPAGLGAMRVSGFDLIFPYAQVATWLNVLSPVDLVTCGRGLARFYPAAMDVAIQLPLKVHSAYDYLSHGIAARAVGDALFGSSSHAQGPIYAPGGGHLSESEAVALFRIAYAHKVQENVKKQQSKRVAGRYEAALRKAQDELAAHLRADATAEDRSIAKDVDTLSDGSIPAMPQRWATDPDVAVQLLVVAATANLVPPFAIDVEDAQVQVLERVAHAMGRPPADGTRVREALEQAHGALASRRALKYLALGTVGVGLLALGPVGIVAGGAAGTAGAAAITSGLAAFGPGGMAGGLALAGALAGGGAAAATVSVVGLLSQDQLEVALVQHMAHALVRNKLRLPPTFDDWEFVVDASVAIDDEVARHVGVSDDDSPIVESLRRRQKMTAKALDWMSEKGLSPDSHDVEPGDSAQPAR